MKNDVKNKEVKTYKVSADGGNSSIKVIYNNAYTSYDNIYAINS